MVVYIAEEHHEKPVWTVGTAPKIHMEHLLNTIEKCYLLRQLVQFLVPFQPRQLYITAPL